MSLVQLIISLIVNTDLISMWSPHARSCVENQLNVQSWMCNQEYLLVEWYIHGGFLNSCRLRTHLAFMILQNFLYRRKAIASVLICLFPASYKSLKIHFVALKNSWCNTTPASIPEKCRNKEHEENILK